MGNRVATYAKLHTLHQPRSWPMPDNGLAWSECQAGEPRSLAQLVVVGHYPSLFCFPPAGYGGTLEASICLSAYDAPQSQECLSPFIEDIILAVGIVRAPTGGTSTAFIPIAPCLPRQEHQTGAPFSIRPN